MSGIAGVLNLKERIEDKENTVAKMLKSLKHRGSKKLKIQSDSFYSFGCANFYDYEYMPYHTKINENDYTVLFDGEIYNKDELFSELKSFGFDMTGYEADLILKMYICFGNNFVEKINGVFAIVIWDNTKEKLFIVRDRFGIKPLYYSFKNNTLVFASEIKAVLKCSQVTSDVGRDELCEVMALGPAQTIGKTCFKDIREVTPSHYMIFDREKMTGKTYWKLNSHMHYYGESESIEYVRELVLDAIKKQLISQEKLCCFLSGGLDSSSIVSIACQGGEKSIDTFSLKYKDNEKYFIASSFQPNSDDSFIDIMIEKNNLNHHVVEIDNENLLGYLYKAMIARDVPGMADVDSSLYYFCEQVGKTNSVAMSGECADEVFGGYPWFHRKEDFETSTFPWAKNIELRENILNKDLSVKLNIREYIDNAYNTSIKETPTSESDTAEEKRRREIAYLNLNWFMYTLGARSERIGMNNGLEIRMPFCDYRLVEYMWNVPWNLKAYKGREKGMLREALKGILPDDVLWRKKSPFPKTHNPGYELLAKNLLISILKNSNSKIKDIINIEFINNVMNEKSDYGNPWFGQLMSTPQLYGYLIQLEYWLQTYNVNFKI